MLRRLFSQLRELLAPVKGAFVTLLESLLLFTNPLDALHFSFLARTNPTRIYHAKFGEYPFIIRWCDWWAVHEVLLKKEYDIANVCLSNSVAPVVLDLGANIGSFSLYVFSVFPAARVYAYEASAQTMQLLTETRRLNSTLNWTIENAAAWREDGSVSFETTALSPSGHVSVNGSECVRAVSLETILLQTGNVDLMKVDIEGAEEALLAGKESGLLAIKNLIVELHPQKCKTDAVVGTLKSSFPNLYRLNRKGSGKPLVLATRQKFDLPPYNA
jgi:FkbM family methyltransferase